MINCRLSSTGLFNYLLVSTFLEVGLVLMGSDDTSNDLNTSLQGFDNIVEFIPVQMSTWEMVRKIEKLEIGSVSSDWIDALVVGLNFARNETQ